MAVHLVKAAKALCEQNPAIESDEMEALREECEMQMNEHSAGSTPIEDYENLEVIGTDRGWAVFEKGDERRMVGYAIGDDGKFYAFMGHCFCGIYETKQEAFDNIVTAFYG